MAIFADKKAVRFCIFLIFLILVVSAQANTAKEFLDILDLVTFEPESERALKHIGEEIHKFVTDKRNANVLKTPYGRELLLRQRKLANYLVIKKKLEECKESNSELTARILDAAGNAEVVPIDCSNPFESVLSLQKYMGDFKQHFDAEARSQLQTYLFEQALKNSASTYLNLKLQFGSPAAPSMPLEFCHDSSGKDLCDKSMRDRLFAHSQNYINNFSKANILTTHQAAHAINTKTAELNTEFDEFGRTTPREITDDHRDSFRNSYVEKYLSTATDGPGILMFTESLKNKTGGGLREASEGRRTREKYILTPHQKINANDVSSAVKEAEDAIKRQVGNLWEMELNHQKQMKGDFFFTNLNTLRNTDLSRLMRTHPQTFGQVLISHPQYASVVCGVIDQVTKKTEPEDKWNRPQLWGGIIIGGIPMVPQGLDDKLVIRDKADSPVISSIGTITTAAGLAVSMDGILQSDRTIEARSLLIDLRKSLLRENKTPEARQALVDFNSANVQATLTLGLAPSEVAALVGSVKAAQRGSEKSIEGLKGTTELLNNISKNPKIVDLIKETRLKGGTEVTQFIGYLGYASENTRNQMINKMNSLSPRQFKKVIDSAISGIYGCGQ